MAAPIKIFRKNKTVPLPKQMTDGAAGFDLHANISTNIELLPGVPIKIPTGIHLEMPDGFEAQVRPRSGLSSKGVMSMFGTVDADYRGEIAAVLINLTQEQQWVQPGDRVAQLVFGLVVRSHIEEVDSTDNLRPTARGENGFGSTGR